MDEQYRREICKSVNGKMEIDTVNKLIAVQAPKV